MALQQALRQLVNIGKHRQCDALRSVASASRAFASSAEGDFTRKDVIYFMNNRDDPEVNSAIKSFLKAQYAKAEQGTLAAEKSADDSLELTAKIERKYVAAQIVESSIQNIPVPLSWAAEGSDTPVKRYVADLLAAGAKAGLEDPTVELQKKLAESSRGVESVKEFLTRVQHLVPSDFHAGLLEAVQEVETGSGTVTLEGSSAGFQAFAKKVQALAAKHKLPLDLLTAPKPAGSQAAQSYAAWLQSARVADVKADLAVLNSEAVKALDTHLTKPADQIRKEQSANLAALVRKLEANKSQKWAATMLEDLKLVNWFDSAVAADPVNGPAIKATA